MSIAQRRFDDRNAISRQTRIAQLYDIGTDKAGRFRKHRPCSLSRPSHKHRGDRRTYGGKYGLTMQEQRFDQMVRAEQRTPDVFDSLNS